MVLLPCKLGSSQHALSVLALSSRFDGRFGCLALLVLH